MDTINKPTDKNTPVVNSTDKPEVKPATPAPETKKEEVKTESK